MKNIIEITERQNRLSLDQEYYPIICGNTNYSFKFNFDELWSACKNKQAIFEVLGKKMFVDFSDDSCDIPAMPNAPCFLFTIICSPSETETYTSNVLKFELEPSKLGEEVQLMDPFVGYYSRLKSAIENIENGNVVAKSASHAEHATSATNADHAASANNADFATTSNQSETQIGVTGDSEIFGNKNFVGNLTKNGYPVLTTQDLENITSNNSGNNNSNSGGSSGINPNLLINPDMKINQRGSDGNAGNNIYIADRWRTGSNNSYCLKTDDDFWQVGIMSSTSQEERIIIMQSVEDFEFYKGKNVTFTLSYSDLLEANSGTTKIAIYDGLTRTELDLTNDEDIKSITATLNENATMLRVEIKTSELGSDVSLIFKWAKLEYGDSYTTFVPRPYPEEIMLCKRYYQRPQSYCGAGYAMSRGTFYTSYPLDCPMRTTPTMVYAYLPTAIGYGLNTQLINLLLNKCFSNQFVLACYVSDNKLTNNHIYSLQTGDLQLDAEIYD